MKNNAEGGCMCGAVRNRLAAEPIATWACHCTNCQTRTGTAFGISMAVPKNGLTLLGGSLSEWIIDREGNQYITERCTECGTHLWVKSPVMPEITFLWPGTLDDSSWVKNKEHIWTRSAQKWVRFDENDVTFETQPEDLSELVEL